MKRIFIILIVCLAIPFAINGQSRQKAGNNPAGIWQFQAPYAPEGFTSGIMEVNFSDNKYSASMAFTGSDYKLPAEKVRFQNDTLRFNLYIEDTDILITLKFDETDKMSGKAVYYEGEVPLTLARSKKQE